MFRCNIDRRMDNSGSRSKPFLFCAEEVREYYCGTIRYCTITVTKDMEDIGDESKPYFVKSFESVRVKVFGVRIRNKEQSWKYTKL